MGRIPFLLSLLECLLCRRRSREYFAPERISIIRIDLFFAPSTFHDPKLNANRIFKARPVFIQVMRNVSLICINFFFEVLTMSAKDLWIKKLARFFDSSRPWKYIYAFHACFGRRRRKSQTNQLLITFALNCQNHRMGLVCKSGGEKALVAAKCRTLSTTTTFEFEIYGSRQRNDKTLNLTAFK